MPFLDDRRGVAPRRLEFCSRKFSSAAWDRSLTGILIVYEARRIIDLRQHSEAPLIRDGILLLTAGALFLTNAHFVRRRGRQFFAGADPVLATVQGYLGIITAFFGAWAMSTSDLGRLWTGPV